MGADMNGIGPGIVTPFVDSTLIKSKMIMKQMDAIIEAMMALETLLYCLELAEANDDPWFTEQFWELEKIKKRIKKYKEYLEAEHGPDVYA